jgi:hypothetical protein
VHRLIRSLARSIGNAIRSDPEVTHFLASHPRAVRFIANRFRRNYAFGLNLTLGLAVTLGFLIVFGGIVQDQIAGDPLVRADLRVLTLIQTLRSAILDQAMLFITYLGNAQIVLASAALLAVYFALTRRWLWLAALVLRSSARRAWSGRRKSSLRASAPTSSMPWSWRRARAFRAAMALSPLPFGALPPGSLSPARLGFGQD